MKLSLPFRISHFSFRIRTLDRYVVRDWLRVFLITLLGFPILVIVIDLTDKLDRYMGRGIAPQVVAFSYVFDLPEKMFSSCPSRCCSRPSSPSCAGETLGADGREGVGDFVSPHRAAAVHRGRGGVRRRAAAGRDRAAATAHRMEMLGEKAQRATSSRYNFVYRADRGWVYAIRSLELRTNEMTDLVLEREGASAAYPTIVLAAQRAVYADTGKARSRWRLHHGALRYLAGSEPAGELAFVFDSLESRTLQERPVDLLAEPKTPEEMRYAELRRYIDALTRSGSNAKKLQVDLALKIAIPFICLLIALFGAPLAISTPKSGAAWGVAASLATTFIVLLMFQLAKAVGAGGVLPPLLAAWTPNILVAVAAVYLLRKAPT